MNHVMYPLFLLQNSEIRPANELLNVMFKNLFLLWCKAFNALLNCHGVHFINYLILPSVLSFPS